MITLATIPARFHAALAACGANVACSTADGVLLGERGDYPGMRYVAWTHEDPVVGFRVDDYPAAALTLPTTDRNTRALAVVLAQACGLDVSGGVIARYHSTQTLELRLEGPCALWGTKNLPALADINPADPDALFRALAACLCALETA